ncbi:hypothetical protein F9K87_00560 [Brucella anthropi]|uniref:hypothetical protein n=1 Tax=Brucella anthropi TaxID=529 RepID=UPI00124D9D04|nr:hypothetical protein [Brucella anthropi]KAB2800004.1 hypothetical protein F9K87_00560 [Brucella anthropi]
MTDKLQPKLRPYLQGNLDSLCGIYALINGIRWALRNDPVSAKGEHWEELFRKLTDHAIKHRGHLELVSEGLSLYSMIALTHIARDHMREYHNVEILVRRPFALGRPREASQILHTIEAHFDRANTAVLAAVYGTLNHWCVVKQFDEHRAFLFDSDRQSYLPKSAFQPQEFIEKARRRAHVQPGSIIMLELKAGRLNM